MNATVYSTEGTAVGELALDESVFGVPMNEAVVHQALVRQRANARAGTSNTKGRSEVAGSTRKLYRQKHTGRARAGSAKSPIRRHGGVIFGPKPRSYRQRMPKKMRRLAIRCVLSGKMANGELTVVDNLEIDKPETKRMRDMLRALGADRSALVATSSPDENVVKSAGNLRGVKVAQARLLNVVDLLSYSNLVMTQDAVRAVEELWGEAKSAV
ncbi:MAG: 50S ribosomal protein L4 [Dehalococcoidia bacterium]